MTRSGYLSRCVLVTKLLRVPPAFASSLLLWSSLSLLSLDAAKVGSIAISRGCASARLVFSLSWETVAADR